MDRLRHTALMAAITVAVAPAAAGEPVRGGLPPVPGASPTSVRVVRAAQLGATLRECRGGPRDWTPRTLVVDRRNGSRRSLAYRSDDARFVDSCDAIGVRIEARSWCAPSTGRLFGGRLRDPRLTLCQARGARPVAFVWVTPRPRARWIGVVRVGGIDLYRVAGGLPVRVSSDRGVRLHGSRATFHVRQYDGRGRLVARETIDARVSG
jgi:hypothetical protein